MTYRERRLARAERLREWAAKRRTRAAAVFAQSEQYRGDIAFNTQPGHIPERARLIAREDRAFASLRLAGSMASRASAIEAQADAAIYSDDTDVVEQLQERIAAREAEVAEEKRINAAWRKGGAKALGELGLAPEVLARHLRTMALCPHLKGPCFTTNTRASIRRDKERLARIEHEAVHGKPWKYLHAAKYSGTCAACGKPVNVGDRALYRTPEIKHFECRAAEGSR